VIARFYKAGLPIATRPFLLRGDVDGIYRFLESPVDRMADLAYDIRAVVFERKMKF